MTLLTAHTKQEFRNLLGELPQLTVELKTNDNASDALFMYLMRLRTGRSYEEVGSHFGVSKMTVLRRCDLVRNVLKQIIVPQYINFEMSRDDLLEHKSDISHILFDGENEGRAHLILDGTYIYLEKSTNHRFQKDTYNTHKMRNYLKIMMGVLTDGRILFVLGPFKATENDATITEKIFNNNSLPSTRSLRPEDIIIVDRGFRDCEVSLINHGFIVKMPTCWDYGKLSTIDANETRFVTKVRYNVERTNGVMKMVWRLFFGTIDIHYIPKIMIDFEIGAALINKKANLVQGTDRSTEMAQKMVLLKNTANVLSTIVEKPSFERLITTKSYIEFYNFESCPVLNLSNLEMISLGNYQVKQARCYLSNHLYENDNCFPVFCFSDEHVRDFCKDLITSEMEPLLLMVDVKSRFVSKTCHRVYVLIDKKTIGHDSVLAYCCTCKAGNRTVGCCSHVMSLIYYVCYAKGEVNEISKHLKGTFEENNWEIDVGEPDAEDDE